MLKPPSKGPVGPFFLLAKAGACAGLLLASLVPTQTAAQARLLPTTTLQVAGVAAHVEIAATPQVRNQGLMFREIMPANNGMLFVFERDNLQCFWMRNTPLPLSIAFIDAQGRIINLRDMQPHSEASHCPERPMRYALEMHRGWFNQYGIKPGDTINGLPVGPN